jgi:hypothetical protein
MSRMAARENRRMTRAGLGHGVVQSGLRVEAPFPGEATETSGKFRVDPVRWQLIDRDQQDQPGRLLTAGRPGQPDIDGDGTEQHRQDLNAIAGHDCGA